MRRIPKTPANKKKPSRTPSSKRTAPGRNARRAGPAERPSQGGSGLPRLKTQLDELLGQEQNSTKLRLRICNQFYKIYLRILYEKGGDEAAANRAYEAWCMKHYKRGATWAHQRRKIGAARIPLSRVRGKYFTYEALESIATAPEIYQDTLFRLGAEILADNLNAALKSAMECRTDEKAITTLEDELTRLRAQLEDEKAPGRSAAAAAGPAGTRQRRGRDLPATLERAGQVIGSLNGILDRIHAQVARGQRPSQADLDTYYEVRDSVFGRFGKIDDSKADLPGIKEADLEVTLTGNQLVISGKREAEKEDKGDRYYTYERTYGQFQRAFTLPEGADTEHIRADLKDGVLTLVVSKKPEVQPKKVPLQSATPKA